MYEAAPARLDFSVKEASSFAFGVILALVLVLSSLQSFYVDRFGGPFLVIAGWALAVCLCVHQVFQFGREAVAGRYYWICLAAITLAAAAHWLATGDSKSSLGLVISASMLVIFPTAVYRNEVKFGHALTAALLVHYALLAVQVAYFYRTRTYLDYIAFTGRESIWWSGKAFEFMGQRIPRFTGAFNEPGTHAGVVAAMLATRYLLNKRKDEIFWLGIIVLFGTASMTGVMLGIGLIAAVGFQFARDHWGEIRTWHKVTALAASAAALLFVIERIHNRLSYTGGPEADPAFQTLAWLFSADSFTLFGKSLETLPNYVSYEYFGVWMSAHVQFGLVGMSTLIAAAIPLVTANPVGFAVLLLAKIKFTYPLIFILIGGALAYRDDQSRRNQMEKRRPLQ